MMLGSLFKSSNDFYQLNLGLGSGTNAKAELMALWLAL